MVTGLLCISTLLVASSCNPCLFIVKFYWNIKKTESYLPSFGSSVSLHVLTRELASSLLSTFISRTVVDNFLGLVDDVFTPSLCFCRISKAAVDCSWFSLVNADAGDDLLSSKDRPASGGKLEIDSSSLLPGIV